MKGDDQVEAKLLVLWSKPEDRAAFDADYLRAHLDLAAVLPDLQDLRAWLLRSRELYRCAELVFDDEAALRRALSSPAGEALAADAHRLERTHDVTSSSHIALTSTRPTAQSTPVPERS